MSTNKRRKAMGSDPLADAATSASEATAPLAPAEPAPPAAAPPPDADLPLPVDVYVPPAPPLLPVPRRGALDPNDRVRTLLVGLLLALLLAVGAQQLNRTAQLTESLGLAEGRLSEVDVAVSSERTRAETLSRILARTEKELEQMRLVAAESQASERSYGQVLTELSRATASAAQWAALADALSAVRSELGFAQRWSRDRWPALVAEFERGDTLRLGRPARLEEIAALRGEVSGSTLQALADASDGLRPWRALGADERLDPYPTIPERGLLLVLLLDAGMSAGDLHAIPFESASLARQSLGAVDLSGVDLNRADLRGTDLSFATLTGTVLTGAVYDARTRWPPGFDPASAGARLHTPVLPE